MPRASSSDAGPSVEGTTATTVITTSTTRAPPSKVRDLPANVRMEKWSVPALDDGWALGCTVFLPTGGGVDSEGSADGASSRSGRERAANEASVVVFAPATGVPGRTYSSMAAWLAGQGHVTVTFDFRCNGGSFPDPRTPAQIPRGEAIDGMSMSYEQRIELLLQHRHVDWHHYGYQDFAAVLLACWTRFCLPTGSDATEGASKDKRRPLHRHRELVVLGNSLGAQMLPLAQHSLRVRYARHARRGSGDTSAAASPAAGVAPSTTSPSPSKPPTPEALFSTAWPDHVPPVRIARALFVGCFTPHWGYAEDVENTRDGMRYMAEQCEELGYMPCDRYGLGLPVPRDAGLQWMRLAEHPEYISHSDEFRRSFDSYNVPTFSLLFRDDHIANHSSRKQDAFSRTLGRPGSVECEAETAYWLGEARDDFAGREAWRRGSPPEPTGRRRNGYLNTTMVLDPVANGWVRGSPWPQRASYWPRQGERRNADSDEVEDTWPGWPRPPQLPAGAERLDYDGRVDVPSPHDLRPSVIGHVEPFRSAVLADGRSPSAEVWELMRAFVDERAALPSSRHAVVSSGSGARRDFGEALDDVRGRESVLDGLPGGDGHGHEGESQRASEVSSRSREVPSVDAAVEHSARVSTPRSRL